MDNENYKDRLTYLSNKVDQLLDNKPVTLIPTFVTDSVKNINIKYILFSIPIIVLILLLIIKPNFILTTVKNKKTFFLETKLSILKLSLVIFINCIIIGVILYIYILKK